VLHLQQTIAVLQDTLYFEARNSPLHLIYNVCLQAVGEVVETARE